MDGQAHEKAKETAAGAVLGGWIALLLGTFGDLENCVLPIKTLECSFNLLNDS